MIRALLLVALAGCSSTPSAKPKPVEPPARLTHTAGAFGKLRFDDGGTGGTPVIFVHGLGGDRLVWSETIMHVWATRRAIALDLHGFGESETTETAAYSIESHADDVVRVMDATNVQKAILVGHSLGGTIVSHVAATSPQRVAGVVLVDPSSDFTAMPSADREGLQKSFAEQPEQPFARMLANAQPGVSDRVLETLRTTKPAPLKGTAVALFAFDPKPNVAAYKGPRVVIIGELLQNWPFGLHKVVPNIEATVMAGTSHWPFLDKPTEFRAHLDAFLAKIP